jgi:hypothetical protein
VPKVTQKKQEDDDEWNEVGAKPKKEDKIYSQAPTNIKQKGSEPKVEYKVQQV